MKKYIKQILDAGNHLVGINRRNLQLVYASNPREHFYLANDKAVTKKLLSENNIPVPETYALIEHSWNIDAALDSLHNHTDIVVKPSSGMGGNGILILQRSGSSFYTPGGKRYSREMLKMHIATILYGAFANENADKCIIEKRIIPHPLFRTIYPHGIADIRIMLHHHQVLMVMLRIPTEKSGGKANLHQGAIGVGVDIDSGLLKNGYLNNRVYTAHPDTNIAFSGITIPWWEKILEISILTANLVPLKFLGVDIIIDEHDGPLVIEINARPGLQIQNANMEGLKI